MPESTYEPKFLSYVFDPFEITGTIAIVDKDKKAKALEEITAYVHEQILSHVGEGKSPVEGESFKKLSAKYAKAFKHGNTTPNLELYGDMLDALTVKQDKGGTISVTIEGDEAEKADGHCKLTGRTNDLPKRRFIPDAEQGFKKAIKAGIKSILSDYADDTNVEFDTTLHRNGKSVDQNAVDEAFSQDTTSDIRVTNNDSSGAV